MNDIINAHKNSILIATSLIIIGVIGRLTLSNILPSSPAIYITLNGITQPLFMMDLFFVIAVITILSALLLRSYYVFLVPIATLIISDIILGNTFIFLFTWSGFAMIGLLFYLLKSKNKFTIKKTPLLFGSSVLSVLIYDLWTNFGSFLGWYPKTFSGLSMCYTVAIPFTMWHLLSTTIAFGLIVMPILYIREKERLNLTYSIKTYEKPVAITLLILSMVLSFVFVFI